MTLDEVSTLELSRIAVVAELEEALAILDDAARLEDGATLDDSRLEIIKADVAGLDVRLEETCLETLAKPEVS